MRVVGLDLSLQSTGWARADGATGTIRSHQVGCPRLTEIRTAILHIAKDPPADFVAIEGYSFGSRNGGERIGELGGVVRVALFGNGIPFVEIPPATLKKYATGRGNAKKPDMRMALYQRTGVDLDDDNQVDAWWLRAFALARYGAPVVDLPASHLEALTNTKIDWPDLEATA